MQVGWVGDHGDWIGWMDGWMDGAIRAILLDAGIYGNGTVLLALRGFNVFIWEQTVLYVLSARGGRVCRPTDRPSDWS